MKRVLSLLLTFAMMFSLSACGSLIWGASPVEEDVGPDGPYHEDFPDPTESDSLNGVEDAIDETGIGTSLPYGPAVAASGWQAAENTELTPDLIEVFEAAVDNADGLSVELEPVSYVGSQVVSGVNHAFLCRIVEAGGEDEYSTDDGYGEDAENVVYADDVLLYAHEALSGNVYFVNAVIIDLGMVGADSIGAFFDYASASELPE